MKQNRVIKLIALLILIIVIIFSFSGCYEYPVNSIGDFFSLVAYVFICLLVKIFVAPFLELSNYINDLFAGSISFSTITVQDLHNLFSLLGL